MILAKRLTTLRIAEVKEIAANKPLILIPIGTIELPMPGIPDYIRRRYPRRATTAYGKKLAEAIIPKGIKKINELMAE